MSNMLATHLNSLMLTDGQSDKKHDPMRIQQITHQLAHWRSLITRFPDDPLQKFWHDRCSTLEGLLTRLQCAGQKRGREEDHDMGKRGCNSFQ
jgi:hypothetical protein